jgi:hypothetical protein
MSSYSLNVGVSLFHPTWGTLQSYANQVDWTTHFTAEGNLHTGDGANVQVTSYDVGLDASSSLDSNSAGSGTEGPWSQSFSNFGTTSWSSFPSNPTGFGTVNMPVYTTASANSRYGAIYSDEFASMSGIYTGFLTVTYNYIPNKIRTVPTPPPGPGGGGWSGGGGWGGNPPPNGACESAYLGDLGVGAPASAYIINLDVPVTLGLLHFDSDTSYTINGPEMLTLDCTHANIVVSRGSHTINAPMHYAADTTVTVMGASNTLTTSNTMTAAVGVAIDKQGPGTWVAKHVRAHSLAVGEGKVQMIADQTVTGTSTVDVLSVTDATGAKLDLNQNHLIIDYAPGSSPYAEIKRLLTAGRNGGTWDGAGIDSSAIATHSGTAVGYGEASVLNKTTFGGVAVDSSSVLVRYTLGGDANLDGTVDFNDLVKLSQHYNGPGDWEDGDFNYDGMVDFDDQVILGQNYNTSLPAGASPVFAVAAVPEPATLGLFAAMGMMRLLRRRR